MTSKVNEGHISWPFIKIFFFGSWGSYLKSYSKDKIFLSKLYVNVNNMKTQIFKKVKYDLQGHWRSEKGTFMLNLSITFIYKQITMKIYINVNLMKTQFFYWLKYNLRSHERSQKITLLLTFEFTLHLI